MFLPRGTEDSAAKAAKPLQHPGREGGWVRIPGRAEIGCGVN